MARLCLTRKRDEAFFVGEAKITIRKIGNRTKIEVEAPDHIKIVREELRVRDLLAGVVQMALEASPKAA